MEDDSLIAQRLIYDVMNNAGANAANFPITKEMKQSCKKACQRQMLALQSKNSDAQASGKMLNPLRGRSWIWNKQSRH